MAPPVAVRSGSARVVAVRAPAVLVEPRSAFSYGCGQIKIGVEPPVLVGRLGG